MAWVRLFAVLFAAGVTGAVVTPGIPTAMVG